MAASRQRPSVHFFLKRLALRTAPREAVALVASRFSGWRGRLKRLALRPPLRSTGFCMSHSR